MATPAARTRAALSLLAWLVILGIGAINVLALRLRWPARLDWPRIDEGVIGSFWLSALAGVIGAAAVAIRAHPDLGLVTTSCRAALGALIFTGVMLAGLLLVFLGPESVAHVVPIVLAILGFVLGRLAVNPTKTPTLEILGSFLGAIGVVISPFAPGDPGFGIVPLVLGLATGMIVWTVRALKRRRWPE